MIMESAETQCKYSTESIFLKEAAEKDQVTPKAVPRPEPHCEVGFVQRVRPPSVEGRPLGKSWVHFWFCLCPWLVIGLNASPHLSLSSQLPHLQNGCDMMTMMMERADRY